MSLKFLSPSQLNIKNHLAMIPMGDLADHKIENWTTADLQPYISYIYQGKFIDTVFGGLIFNPISTRPGRFIYPLYATFGNLANIEDWKLAIDNLFKLNFNLHAAYLCGKPLDIWVSLPYPLSLQNNFGYADNVNINFEDENHRFLALKWWINSFLDRWRSEVHLHSLLTFKGFTWQREAIIGPDNQLVVNVNKYIHDQHLLSMWLPNYGSNSINDWQKIGFDVTCINSNYYGNTTYDWKWLNYASAFAKFYHTGMQINYGKGIVFSPNHLIDYLNLGLPQYNSYMNDCVIVYNFPNQNLKDVFTNNFTDYIRVYSFAKGIYMKVPYPDMPY